MAEGAAAKSPQSPPQRTTISHHKGKLVVLGDISVGKTAIVQRCEDGRFNAAQKNTIGIAFTQKTLSLPEEGIEVKLDVWDSAGEERFRSINSLYYHGAAAGIIVFDVTKRSSFENAKSYWVPHLREHGVEGIIIALVANKCDLDTGRQVDKDEAVALAETEGIAYFEASAKTGVGVMGAFLWIARQVPAQAASAKPGQEGFRITRIETRTAEEMARSRKARSGGGTGGCC